MARLIAELERDPPPFLLLHEAHWPLRRSPIFSAQTVAHDHLRYLLMTPYLPAGRRDSRDQLAPLQHYLERTYTLVTVRDGYLLFRRASLDTAMPPAATAPRTASIDRD